MNVTSIVARYSVIFPFSTCAFCSRRWMPVTFRSVLFARFMASSAASCQPRGDDPMILVTRATAMVWPPWERLRVRLAGSAPGPPAPPGRAARRGTTPSARALASHRQGLPDVLHRACRVRLHQRPLDLPERRLRLPIGEQRLREVDGGV